MENTPVVERIRAIIDECPESNMSLSEMADSIGISVYYMSHVFKKTTSVTIIGYRTSKRIDKARELLVTTRLSVTEIAYACGFSSQGYFSERFVKTCGISPSAYRQKYVKEEK